MIRVVADTNVFISAIMFGGLPGVFLDLALLRPALLPAFILVTSPALLNELDEKLRTKFQMSPSDTDAVRGKLESASQLVEPRIALDVVKDDPDDNRVLECATEGNANYIVSGDRHLLRLKSYSGIPILTVRQFLDVIGSLETPGALS